MNVNWTKRAGNAIFAVRWVLYPINVALVVALSLYVVAFLVNDYRFIVHQFTWDMESLMVMLLGFVDASMVANLIVMVVQGGHRIFIHRFDIADKSSRLPVARPYRLRHPEGQDRAVHRGHHACPNPQRFRQP